MHQDAEAGSVHHLIEAGLVFHELWRTAGPLASNHGNADPVPEALEVMPERGGTALRLVEIAPTEPGAVVEMHETPTTDYNIVVEGSVHAVSDTGEVELSAGDVLVQRGGRHGWRNGSGRTCKFVSVMVNDR
ncbi:hypothetical protein C6I20_02975 [Aeromicrobium sp. A1-2]|nr:hypothetical protein C6I20_02975 [Aeromicrobium sp. A1-2]